MKKEIIILCLIFIGGPIINGFELLPNNEQNNLIHVDMGKSFTMVCKADDDYEYCRFEHNGNKCVFEWKRKSGEVELQTDECEKYRNRITFIGDYSQYTCGMQLDNVTLEDAGRWTCELEEYKWCCGSGDTDMQTVSLIVNMTTSTEGSGYSTNADNQYDNQENNSTQTTEVSTLDKIWNTGKEVWNKGKEALTKCRVNCKETD